MGIRELREVNVFSGNCTSACSLQEIQTFSDSNFTQPCFFVFAIKAGKVLVGGQEYFLSKIFGVKWIADRFQAYGKY